MNTDVKCYFELDDSEDDMCGQVELDLFINNRFNSHEQDTEEIFKPEPHETLLNTVSNRTHEVVFYYDNRKFRAWFKGGIPVRINTSTDTFVGFIPCKEFLDTTHKQNPEIIRQLYIALAGRDKTYEETMEQQLQQDSNVTNGGTT